MTTPAHTLWAAVVIGCVAFITIAVAMYRRKR